MNVSWAQAIAWRLRRHHLVDRAAPRDLIDVVERLRGLHAQVMSSVDLALSARIDGLTREAVDGALWRDRTLVKMWAMRATLHVLPARELGTWIAGLGIWAPGTWPIKEPEATRLAPYIDRALRGRVLTRLELAAAVRDAGASATLVDGMLASWSASLRYASFAGCLCFAENDGAQVRFTHPSTWLRTPPSPVDRAAAFDALTLRYLGSYGPATTLDLGPRWWGINQGGARQRLMAVGDAAAEISVEGKKYWMRAEDIAELAAAAPVVENVRLLPAFDQWVVCASRRVPALVAPEHLSRIYRQQGWVSPVLLIDGRMAGVWSHETKGRTLSVIVEPFAALPRWTRPHIGAEAERLAAFLGGDLKLTIRR